MKKNRKQSEFLEHLKKIPIVLVACEKAGLSRNSVYRWRKEDITFAEAMYQALGEGEDFINDMSESQLITLIKEKNWPATSFWLRHRNAKFKERIEIEGGIAVIQEMSPEQRALYEKAVALAKLTSESNE